MNDAIKRLPQLFFIGCFSGLVYTSLEVLYRGYTHMAMWWLAFIVGIFILVLNNTILQFDTDYGIQVIVCAVFCTFMELIFGLLFNQDYSIWDYRNLAFNYRGQICLVFTLVWVGISAAAIILLDWMDWKFFKTTQKPYYRFKLIDDKKHYLY